MKIGIIRERKNPLDNRVPLTPKQCQYISELYPVDFVIEPSPNRCYTDEEYRKAGLCVSENVQQCDILMGVKEVPIADLHPFKSYMFFSHTMKKQPFNQKLLRAILDKHIRMIDYEALKDVYGGRLIAFGHYAGMVGAHNALWMYGKKTNQFSLPRACESSDYQTLVNAYQAIKWQGFKICLTGNGRVAHGAIEVLKAANIREISPEDYLKRTFDEAVFTQLHARHYVKNKVGLPFVKNEFYNHPERFESNFSPFLPVTDIFINGIFWDVRAPQFFSLPDMAKATFNIKVIADITCDIAPESSVPSTFFASTIAEPVFGFDPNSQQIVPAFSPNSIDIMSIDNLPNELPRDASEFFGKQFLENILPELLHYNDSGVVQNAIIAQRGELTPIFEYLRDYATV